VTPPSPSPGPDELRLRLARQALAVDRGFGVDIVPRPLPPAIAPRVETAAADDDEPAGNDPADTSPAAEPDTPEPTEMPVPVSRDHAPASPDDPEQRLAGIRRDHDDRCPLCTTATTHENTVFGEGNPRARLMFVGEAPGAEEDRAGRPFVGRSGQLLDKMIEAMGLARGDVYIANIVKSRPLDNATPTPMQVDQCSPWLVAQVRVVDPEVIVALGAPATKFLLETTEGIGSLRGSFHECTRDDLSVPVMPTYHPAYLLRNYTAEVRGKVWSDLQQVMRRLGLEPGSD